MSRWTSAFVPFAGNSHAVSMWKCSGVFFMWTDCELFHRVVELQGLVCICMLVSVLWRQWVCVAGWRRGFLRSVLETPQEPESLKPLLHNLVVKHVQSWSDSSLDVKQHLSLNQPLSLLPLLLDLLSSNCSLIFWSLYCENLKNA